VTGLSLAWASRSDPGLRRPNNEDALFASPRLVAVADGVGGGAAGEVASLTAINALAHLDKCRRERPLEVALAEAVRAGNETIAFVAGCRPQYAGMGTTVTAAGLDDDAYVVANVGDSRIYLLRDGGLRLLTHDESLVQMMLDAGTLSAAEARAHPHRSVVTQALDGRPDLRVAVSTLAARPGDRLLLCSDGLSDLVDDDAIAAALSLPDRRASADRLVALALEAGGRDNVSVVVADVVRQE
jgi:serine/threonine protein phosphatase PrpC